jgi:probable HAF family extracellular repeat protein
MRHLSAACLVAALCACDNETEITRPSEALTQVTPEPHYRVEIIESTLGGTLSRGSGINNRGWVAGFSNLAGNATLHAALWRDGAISDLGTLGGPGSRVPWPGINNEGMVVGISQTAELDPLNEAWSCEAAGFLPQTTPRQVCLGFWWENGVMHPLPTLGGTHGFAAGVNNRGQVVGWAETAVHDPTCTGVQVLQFRAVMWEPKEGRVQELRPLPGDSASSAVGINERGQAVGNSGDCDQAVGRFTAKSSVIWEHGIPRKIPDLGGITWHTPQDINEAGDVVGFSNPPGEDPVGTFIAHAFLWKYGSEAAIDLGTLPDNVLSQGQALNGRGQVVGVSFGGTGGTRAFLWEDGVMRDLNALVGPGFGLGLAYRLVSARDINDAGVITGDVFEAATGLTLAFRATPVAAPLVTAQRAR